MAETRFHIVIESPKYGMSPQRAYMATPADVASRGWNKTDRVERIQAIGGFLTKGDVVDENDEVLYEDFSIWKAGPDDVYVSVASYPATKKVKVLKH